MNPMLNGNLTKCLTLLAVGLCALQPRTALGGPFIDWLFGGRRQPPAYPVGPSFPVAANSMGAYYGAGMPIVGANGYGYPYQAPGGVAAATLPQPTVAYLPDYRSTYYRAPVTYYRPILTTDPASGAQVVTLAPCSSYEYQTQRVPVLGTQPYYGWYGAQPMPQQMGRNWPMAAIPNGGVPLTGVPSPSYAAGYPNYAPVLPPESMSPNAFGYPTNGYVSGYGPYSVLQPPVGAAAPMSAYPTSPYANGGYYGTTSGGCTGSFAPPPTTPGLSYPMPSTVSPPSGFESAPTQPQVQGPLFNPPAPSTAPAANEAPALPPGPSGSAASLNPPTFDSTSRFQNVVRQPASGFDRSPLSAPSKTTSPPLMEPIPVPDEYKQVPRWNPGLLKESDQTAQAITSEQPAIAAETHWGSKKIQWASFTQPANSGEMDTLRAGRGQYQPNVGAESAHDTRSQLRLTPSISESSPGKLPERPAKPAQPKKIGGWKPVR